jgi:hypothetical protein
MKLIKTLIVWLLLLAIPLQGHAAVSANLRMMSPGSASINDAPVMAAHCAGGSHHADAAVAKAHCEKSAAVHKCSHCASCSVSAFLFLPEYPATALTPHGSERIAYVAAFITSRLPDGLERPPHSQAA